MADKNFGDYNNRNVVKNPLLSTAVTGLSFEDLTHNAVLLPVPLIQEVITQPEQQYMPQNFTLQHTEHAVSSHQAGDANSNEYPLQYPPTNTNHPTSPQNQPKPQETYGIPTSTVSKASLKSEDDFDVNEYIARLHGTRYVSAPLNSALKEDKNANLEATEENLEEINLNEPEKQVDVQQSLTADIAQNFSQLPTVLPQMASAVFSSFSSMLQTRKSRDPTPEVTSGYLDVQFERPGEDVKELLPPPREPPREPPVLSPSVGTCNYRLPPKKKYAQIPGLSSGETVQSPYQPYQPFSQSLPPTIQNIPQYFVPSSIPNEQSIQENIQDSKNANLGQTQFSKTNTPSYFAPTATVDLTKQKTETPKTQPIYNVAAQNIPDEKGSSKDKLNVFPVPPHLFNSQDSSQISVLPPPPMFANQQRSDSQLSAGKSLLPPSVARRIGANQPIIKQTQQIPAFTENIFIPAPVDAFENKTNFADAPPVMDTSPSNNIHQSAYTPFNSQSLLPSSASSSLPQIGSKPTADTVNPPSIMTPALPPQTWPKSQETGTQLPIFPSSTTSAPRPGTRPAEVSRPPPPFFETPTNSTIVPSIYEAGVSKSSTLDSGLLLSNTQASSQIPPSIFTPPAVSVIPSSVSGTFPSQAPKMPQIFTAANDFVSTDHQTSAVSSKPQGSLPPPPTFFNPSTVTAEIKEFPPINTPPVPIQEPPKSIPEPPKASSLINYRMTKKKPQYYAGPIEGVGAISNSIKPILAPLNTGTFQGDLFTPQQGENIVEQVKNLDQYTEQTPFDIIHPAGTTFSNVPLQPQLEGFNTSFDMSRPTTESYNEPRQETTGFGLLGSLKSKLGALDINKIQNTVTTFFDPAYNDSKKDTSNEQKYVPESPQQYEYSNTENSNFEIFVPNIGQASAHGYNYQTPYQNLYDYNQPPQQYPESQPVQQHYQNPTQNVDNYFSDETNGFKAPLSKNIPVAYSAGNENKETAHNEETHCIQKSRENMDASKQSDIKIHQSYSALSHYDINAQPFEAASLPSLPPHNLASNVSTKAFTSELETIQPKIIDSSNTFSNATNFLSSSQFNIAPPKDFTSGEYENVTDNVPLISESLTKSFITRQQETPYSKETKQPASNEPTTLNSSFQLNEGPRPIQLLQDSAKNFFDNSAILAQPKESLIQQHFTTHPSFESRGTFEAAVSFFDSPPQDELDIQTGKNIAPPKNIGFEITQKLKTVKAKDGLDGEPQNVTLSLQTNAPDFFSSLNPGDSKMKSIISSAFDFNKTEIKEQQRTEVITNWPEETRLLDMSSAPLFGLSTMLANKTKELNDLETEIKSMTIQESENETSYFETLKSEQSGSMDDVPDLNICETCREVNKPDEWDKEEIDDLTTQLIENITSPIQLSNPVEVPLTESNTPADDDLEDFDRNQCEEISHITEETMEAIQVQAASELLDDDQKVRDYGWSNQEVSLPLNEPDERDYTFEQPTGLEQHNYALPVNPSAIGFFGSNTLYENIADKRKTDFESQENVTRVLPRQMSIPTAPLQDDYTKSDALDVHSIEQDASKDFPIFEEFVIEPDNEDDKPDNNNGENTKIDSFSSRVDMYKKKDEVEGFAKVSPTFVQHNKLTTSPSIMPSYFDTGNYAADNHYRNSLTSPTANLSFAPQNQISVPPGFEEEFQRRLSTHEPFAAKPDEPFIPDTSTQTRPIYSPTFSIANQNTISVTTVSNISTVSDRGSEVVFLPDFSSVFGAKKDLTHEISLTASLISHTLPNTDYNFKAEENLSDKPLNFGFGDSKEDTTLAASIFKTPKNVEPVQLPDPINFFASSSATVQESGTQDVGVNRLASYFSSPTKPDHPKSFFELSQSQNHYRHISEANSTKTYNPDITKQLINPNLTESNPKDKQNIPIEQYVANFNLMRDLTSVQHAEFKPEHVVRTVNYFTIEYDNERLVNDITNGLLSKETPFNSNINQTLHEGIIPDDEILMATLYGCKHCCNLTVGRLNSTFKVKKCMDENAESKKDCKMDNNAKNFEPITSTKVNIDDVSSKEDAKEGVSIATESRMSAEYSPVRHHWFYRVDADGKSNWRGFSVADSQALENAFHSPDLKEDTVVPTDGGRFDVNVTGRLRVPVYWTENPTNVMRCSWFYKGTTDARYVPYAEAVAEKLEEEYRHGVTTGEWHRRLVLPNNEMVVMHGPAVMVHFLQAQTSDAFSTPPLGQLFTFGKRVYRNPPKIRVARDQTAKIDHLIMLVHGAGEYRCQKEKIQSATRPRVVRRGHDESEIEEMEPSSIDHLLLLCHGVGSACDMRFRNVEEVVDDFRSTSLQLIQSHYKEAYDSGRIGRVEVLPISWHATLHSGETGVDRRLARITLDSIPRLRNFTNDTVLDVLFYTSPVFAQTIINTVCAELNRIYSLFRKRNPAFKGGVSLGGHSLGSVIIYDLLCHQPAEKQKGSDMSDKRYVSGAASTGQPSVHYPTLDFAPVAMYALGSPIAIFECIRGVDFLGTDFSLPTCKNFFNVFHPYDPIAYRIEPLINPALRDYKPFLIPHHKGRKRMHLELKDTMARVGADIKQKLIESFRSTWTSMWKTAPPAADGTLEKVVEEELEKDPLTESGKEEVTAEEEVTPALLGALNAGRRVDYVLQEAPFEMINEYLFAMSSHVCYWESEDTMLLMLREIYDALGVRPDNTVPQQSFTVERTRTLSTDADVVPTDFPSTSKGPS